MMQLDLKELRNELDNEKQQYESLRHECDQLRNDFKNEYSALICPIFLSRNPDKSHTPLFWRYSSRDKGNINLRPKTDDFWALISKMDQRDKQRLSEFEFGRIRLNYQIGISAYKVLKLEQLVQSLNEWENNIRSTV